MKTRYGVRVLTISLLVGANACGDKRDAEPTNFLGALSTVSSALDDMSKLKPGTLNLQSLADVNILAGFGSAWTTGTVRLPDQSDDSVSIKDYMGKQLDPAAVGEGDEGREFALNVFGRFDNSMMIGCALMTVGNIDASTGYPADGTLTIAMTTANLALMVEKCGMAQAEADYMGSQSPQLEITATVATPSDTSVYDKKITMNLPAGMGGATQYFYLRFNSEEINIFNAEDGEFDSRTMVNMNLATKVLKVEYFSRSTQGEISNMYFHRLYYDETNDIGKLTTYYGGSGNNVKYTLAGKPSTGGTFALSFTSDQTTDYNGQACVGVTSGNIETDDSLACTITGTAVADATVITDSLARFNDASWVTPSETISNTYTVDSVFTAVAP